LGKAFGGTFDKEHDMIDLIHGDCLEFAYLYTIRNKQKTKAMKTSIKSSNATGIGFSHKSILKVGDKFTITHIDGYVANETVAEITYSPEGQFYYTCESCATYNETDLRSAN